MSGSRQLRDFRRAIRDGKTLMTACVLSGLSLAEGKLTLAADAADPPPPEAFEPLIGERKEMEMARAAAKPKDDGAGGAGGQINGEYIKPDAEAAFRIYDTEIKSKKAVIAEKTGDLSEPYSRIKDKCHFPRKMLDLIISLENMEESKRDHNLLALSEGLRVRKLFLPRDLVTMAGGEEGTEIVKSGTRPKPRLVTVPDDHPEDDSDLSGDADEDSAVDKAKASAAGGGDDED